MGAASVMAEECDSRMEWYFQFRRRPGNSGYKYSREDLRRYDLSEAWVLRFDALAPATQLILRAAQVSALSPETPRKRVPMGRSIGRVREKEL